MTVIAGKSITTDREVEKQRETALNTALGFKTTGKEG